MNDVDKEAFKNWYTNKESEFDNCKEAWQAACEYKQKDIDELEKEKDYLCKKMENMREIFKNSEKLQAENAKLRECVEFYGYNLDMEYAREVLRELNEKN